MPRAVGTQLDPNEIGAPLGAGGWLLLFIFTLVFFGPAAHVFAFLRGYRHSMEIFPRSTHPYSLYEFYFVEQLVGFAVYGYGIFAGIQLWKTRPAAVKHAKQFIIALVAYRLADFVVGVNWVSVMAPHGTLSKFLSWRTVKPVLNASIYGAVWYSYLLKSKRVRMTFLLKSPRNIPSRVSPG